MNEEIAINQPPSDLRVLMLILYEQGAQLENLIHQFRPWLEQDLICQGISLQNVITTMLENRNILILSFLSEQLENGLSQLFQPDEPREEVFLNSGQEHFVNSVLHILHSHELDPNKPYLIFLQGRAGTGKTYTTNALIQKLKQNGKNVLVSATTGIAASQYQNGQTVHSLFGLTIDQKIQGNELKSNIGLHTTRCEQLM